ncbi:DUF4330 domain-containing protein [Desulfolucanica intricata]|uniref:DUF4330 domain-containing protein n=1 Tax=Desulfolucanica intricata TaxID=1285191 RepID=UPI00082D5EE0|nr:DUF4330 domain-containing protein [Desulfolucanica intricata]
MVIISEKRKILELPGIIDLTIILITLSLIAGTALFFSPPAQNPVSRQKVVVTLVVHQIPAHAAQLIQAGDQLSTGDNKVLVKSAKVKPAPLTNASGTINTALKDIYVTLEGLSTISEGSINLGGQEISIGRKYQLISENYNLTGVIDSITLH